MKYLDISLLEEEPPSRMYQLVVYLSVVTVLVARRKSSQNLKTLQVFFDCVWKEINDIWVLSYAST